MISTEERSSPLGMFLLGLMFGVAAGGIGVYVWQQREIQRRSARVEADAAKEIRTSLSAHILTPVTNSPNSTALHRRQDSQARRRLRRRFARRSLAQRVSADDARLISKRCRASSSTNWFTKSLSCAICRRRPASANRKRAKAADGKSCEYYCTANWSMPTAS